MAAKKSTTQDEQGPLVRHWLMTPTRIQKVCEGESLTRQSDKPLCDVNSIVQKYTRTGAWTHTSKRQARFADVTGARELKEALDLVHNASEEFMDLPAEVRALAANDPVQLLEMLEDQDDVRDLIEAGLDATPRIHDGVDELGTPAMPLNQPAPDSSAPPEGGAPAE